MTHSFDNFAEAIAFAREENGKLTYDRIAGQWIVTILD